MAARLARFLPRFSISNLLMLMVVIGVLLAWSQQRRRIAEQADVIDTQRREIKRLTVNGILASNVNDDQKAEALRPLVPLGERLESLEAWCGPRKDAEFEPNVFTFDRCDLTVRCDAAGRVESYGYTGYRALRCELFPVYMALSEKPQSPQKVAPQAAPSDPSTAPPQGILSQHPELGNPRR